MRLHLAADNPLSLTLTYNEHEQVYETIRVFLAGLGADDDVVSRCETVGDAWILHLYPDTPVGFAVYIAPTLAEVWELAARDGHQMPKWGEQ